MNNPNHRRNERHVEIQNHNMPLLFLDFFMHDTLVDRQKKLAFELLCIVACFCGQNHRCYIDYGIVAFVLFRKRHRVLAKEGNKITSEISIYLVQIVLEERSLDAVACATIMSLMAMAWLRKAG